MKIKDDLIVLNKSKREYRYIQVQEIMIKLIVNALIKLLKKILSNIVGEKYRPGIVHRIDKDTSGLIVIAKNNKYIENLSEQFKKHTIDRIYLALVWGKLRPRSGKIETFYKAQLLKIDN